MQLKYHNITKVASLILVLAILTPIMVKSYHGFENHKHDVCVEKYSTHFHAVDLDCEFYKFKLSNTYYQSIANYTATPLFKILKKNTSYYFFLTSHQQDSSYLRGPPRLV